MQTGISSHRNGHRGFQLARGLGYFSIGLGILEIARKRSLSRRLGLQGHGWILPTYGVREMVTGGLILQSRDPKPWIWMRIAGDALDIATLALGYRRDSTDREDKHAAMASVAGATALDIYCTLLLGEKKN